VERPALVPRVSLPAYREEEECQAAEAGEQGGAGLGSSAGLRRFLGARVAGGPLHNDRIVVMLREFLSNSTVRKRKEDGAERES
jgi:hypothetical protein